MVIVYDGQCPFCAGFVRLMALRERVGEVLLVDARSDNPAVAAVRAHGVDLDSEMAVLHGDRLWRGAEAVALISHLTPERGLGRRALARLLANPRRAAMLYPWLRAGRRATLKLLRRAPIAT